VIGLLIVIFIEIYMYRRNACQLLPPKSKRMSADAAEIGTHISFYRPKSGRMSAVATEKGTDAYIAEQASFFAVFTAFSRCEDPVGKA
jgi:hypothetical protein